MNRLMRIGAMAALSSLGSLFVPAHSPAQEPEAQAEPSSLSLPEGRPVTLSEVIARARQNPPAVLSALAALERFEAQEHQAKGAYLPKLTVGAQAGVMHNNYPYPVRSTTSTAPLPQFLDPSTIENRVTNLERLREFEIEASRPENLVVTTEQVRVKTSAMNSMGSANLDWTLIDLSRGGAVDSASAQKQAQAFAVASAQRVAIQAAVQLYVRSLAARMLIDDARLSFERRNDQLKSIAALVRAGVRPAVDAQRAEIEAVAARHNLDIRAIEHQQAMAGLAAALGEDPAKPLRPVELEHDPFTAPTTLDAATKLAIESRPEVKQAETLVMVRQADHRSAIGMRLPVFGLSGTGQLSYSSLIGDAQGIEGRQLNASAFAYMRWSALDATVFRRAKVTSKAVIESQKQFEQMLLQVKGQVAEALYGAQITKAQLDRANETLAAATTTRQAQNERYRAGVSTLLELLDAEELEQNARRARIEAVRDYDIARANLLAICGTIDKIR